MKSKSRKVAVFDIDGTIFRSSLLIELVETLIAMGYFPERARSGYESEWHAWLDRKGRYEDYISAVIKVFHKEMRGLSENNMKRAVRHLLKKQNARVYRYTRDLIVRLKKDGYFTLAISHSPLYAVKEFAQSLGFDKVYARLYEIDAKKKFTGKVLMGEWIDDKARILKRAVQKENLTLRGSVAVGDTESDIKMLKSVQNPACFNPNEGLLKAAKRNNWPVVVERKDVIYSFEA